MPASLHDVVKYDKISHFHFRKWLELQDIKRNIVKAVGAWNEDRIASLICSFVSTALNATIEPDLPWLEIVQAFYAIEDENSLSLELPLLKAVEKEQELPWDYEGRTFYFWAAILSKNFGWTLEYIAELEPDDAIAMIQECLTQDQLEKEWQWSTTEIAYSYDEASKKSEFSPLPRPSWMAPLPKLPKVVTIPKEYLPVGNVVRWKN